MYAYRNKIFRDFKVGEHVFLKVKVKRSSIRLGCCPKLAVRYCGPFEILEKVCNNAYLFILPHDMCIYFVVNVENPKLYNP